MSLNRNLPQFDPALIAQMEAMQDVQVRFNARQGGDDALAAISELAGGVTGDELIQAVKLWKSSHDQGMQNMHSEHATQQARREPLKAFHDMTGKERAALRRSDPAGYSRLRDGDTPGGRVAQRIATGADYCALTMMEKHALKLADPATFDRLRSAAVASGRVRA